MSNRDPNAQNSEAKSNSRRLFLAIPLSTDIRGRVAELSGRLQKGAHFTPLIASWVPPENFHMTLHFLGSVPEDRVAQLEAQLRNLPSSARALRLSFCGLGYFPHPRAPKVLWLGVRQPPKELEQLVALTGRAITEAGVPLQHDNFHPHITLARFKSLKGTAAFVAMARSYEGAEAGTLEVETLMLMESCLGKGAPEYREVFPIGLS
jgi:2'-5' RNA ligase